MIYLIDDDTSVRRACEMFLGSAGMEFASFGSASEFESTVTPGLEDIIVLDLHLPGISGIDFLKKLESEGTHIKVIVVTAFDDQPSREYCLQYGVKAFMRKPVDGEALMDLIKYNLSNKI
jgi:FixJ family two-component response regulator